ncbi:hypothetical protein SAMN03159473_05033 [Pseudomonas sp. NFACC52]|nr:hypothetical protein SAMN03159481_03149 [Pseudomonas sp. NFACC56-3]SFK98054.1 hypothetical protein SAMN03159473_05033 [Pseudomonas sp. NFACC52]
MQEQKKGNRSMLQIAGPLFANPSNPASTACRLIFQDARSRPMTALRVSHRPVVAPLVTHFETPVTLRHVLLQTSIFIHPPNLWRGSLLPLGCEAAPKPGTAVVRTPYLWRGDLSPRHKGYMTRTKKPRQANARRGFLRSQTAVRQRSWSCASRSSAPPHPGRPGWRYHPTRRIPPWRSCAGCGA